MPAVSAVEAVPDDGRFYFDFFDDHLVVVDLPRRHFALLNGSAARCWLSFLDTPTDPERLRSDVADADAFDTLVSEWRHMGWLRPVGSDKWVIHSGPETGPAAEASATDPARQWLNPYQFASATVGSTRHWCRDLQWHGVTIGVDLLAAAEPIHRDFIPRAAAFLSGVPLGRDRIDMRIQCHVMEDAIYLRCRNRHMRCTDVVDALSRLVLWVIYGAYGFDRVIGTLHAAAVGNGNGSILMPAVSGAGKSTLTAWLVARGWRYGGDDLIGLGHSAGTGTVELLPFPSAISVKRPSLDLLAADYPQLPDLPEVDYADKTARFLPVPPERLIEGDMPDRLPRALVFPRYSRDAATALRPLRTRDALTELAGIGLRTGERLAAAPLADLLGFVDRIPKYALTFSSLAEAEQCLSTL